VLLPSLTWLLVLFQRGRRADEIRENAERA
jgi:hypothetical protein